MIRSHERSVLDVIEGVNFAFRIRDEGDPAVRHNGRPPRADAGRSHGLREDKGKCQHLRLPTHALTLSLSPADITR